MDQGWHFSPGYGQIYKVIGFKTLRGAIRPCSVWMRDSDTLDCVPVYRLPPPLDIPALAPPLPFIFPIPLPEPRCLQ